MCIRDRSSYATDFGGYAAKVLVTTSGAYAPAVVSPVDGMGATVTSHPTTTVWSIGAAVPTGYSVSTFGVSVPSGSVVTAVSSVYQSPSVPSVPSIPSIPAVPSVPFVPSTVSVPSVYFNPPLNGGVPQAIYRFV